MNIYRRHYPRGHVSIRLRKIGPNLRGVPLSIFIGPDPTGAAPLSCGGNEKVISRVGTPSFVKCKQIYNNE